MSCHGYGPVDTGLQSLLKPKEGNKKGNHDPPMLGGLDRLNESQETLESFPSGSCSSSGENGENRADGEVSTTGINPGFKNQKSVSFEDLSRNSIVAGLWVNILEKDIDGAIRWVKVTHSENE